MLPSIVSAYSAGHSARLGKGVVQFEADNAVNALAVLVCPEPVAQDAEGLLAVVVVTVDYCKRLLDHVLGHQHCVSRTPWFLPFRVEGEPCRNLVEFLYHELELERAAVCAAHLAVFLLYHLLELLAEIFAHNIDHLAEAGFHRIVNGVVDYRFTVRTESVHLFESAVTASHSGS